MDILSRFHNRPLATLRNLLFRIALMLVIGMAGVLLSLTEPVDRMEEAIGLGGLFRIRQFVEPAQPPDDVVIVEIDRDSIAAFDLSAMERRKWPRWLDADLVHRLKADGVFLTVFDMVFEDASTPQDDQALAQAIREARNVVLAQHFDLVPMSVGGNVYEDCWRKTSLDDIEQAALASAPIPVPELESRDTAIDFATIDPSCGATLPAVVFHLYLLRHASDSLSGLLNDQDRKLARDIGSLRGETVHRLIDAVSEALPNVTALPTTTSGDQARLMAALARMHGDDTRFVINHYGPSGSIKTCTLQDVLSRSGLKPPAHCAPDALRDKVVFVGFSKNFEPERNREQFKSPFGKVSMVELIATTFANIVQNDAIDLLQLHQRSWLLLAWGGLIGLCYSLFYFPRAILLVTAISAGYVIIACWSFVHGRTWLPLVVPIGLQATVPSIIALAGFIVPRAPRKLDALIFASDMRDHVKLAETLSASVLSHFRTGYFKVITDVLERHGGTFANQVADDYYGYWEQPPGKPACAAQACAAALAISAAVQRYIADQPIKTPLRIGLHLGQEELIPNLTIERREYRFIGKCSGIASRIENMNKVLQPDPPILLSASALPDGDAFLVRRLGRFLLQGLDEPLQIHHLLGWTQDSRDATRELIRRFEAALILFEERNAVDALFEFHALHQEFPDDSPTAFYVKHLQHARHKIKEHALETVIRIGKSSE